jgi:hypothetical protein
MGSFSTALIQDLFFTAVLIGLAVFLARKRGRNPFLWGIGGILIIPTIVLFFLPAAPKQD